MLRIRSWNVNGLGGPEVWDDIAASDVDVALLQECRRPPAGFDGRVVPDRDGEWRTAGWTERPPWDRRTAIVAPTDGPSRASSCAHTRSSRSVTRTTVTRSP